MRCATRWTADFSGTPPIPHGGCPTRQKTLSDQARIALAYLGAAGGEDSGAFERCARGALDFALSKLGHPDGTFGSAIDATGDESARYYSWTSAEIDKVLGPDAPGQFKAAHGVERDGNVAAGDDPSGVYASRNLLRSAVLPDPNPSAAARLLAVRDLRRAPPRDERASAEAHGLILAALARAAAQLSDRRYAEAARRTLGAIEGKFLTTKAGDLRRLADSSASAAPEDYAAVALGVREFARDRRDGSAEALAQRLIVRMNELFLDPSSHRYFSSGPAAAPGVFVRTLSAGDPPAPESLALLAGVPAGEARDLLDSQLDSLDEESVQAPGDQLLAIASALGNKP